MRDLLKKFSKYWRTRKVVYGRTGSLRQPKIRREACLAGLLALVVSTSVVGQEREYSLQKVLKPILKITWTEGVEYPMGIQDSACGVLDGKFISGGGFTRHPKEVTKVYPDAFDGKPDGFTKLAFLLEPLQAEAGWMRVLDIPGPARQGAAVAVVGDALYAIGGFNYTEPLTYRATYRLRKELGKWVWTELECKLPWPVCEASAAVIGTKIYLVGGADYFQVPGTEQPDFHVQAGRDNSPVGSALLVLDTADIKAGWKRLADLPGAPRLNCGCGVANGKIYVLGGVYASTNRTDNVVDSWVYDPEADRWSRVRDTPDGANRRAVVFKDRYIILMGEYQYGKTWHPDGSQTDVYTPEKKKLSWKSFFGKTVLVYDTKSDLFGTADPLLDQTSWPCAAIQRNTIFCLGGEGGAHLWHPATFQIGKVEEMSP